MGLDTRIAQASTAANIQVGSAKHLMGLGFRV